MASLALLRSALWEVAEIQRFLVTGIGEGRLPTVIAQRLTSCHGRLRDNLVQLVTAVDAITHQSCHDPLTGLPNRTLLMDRLHQAIALADRNETQVAVLVLDLDDFKAINDTHGHSAGDQALRHVASSIQTCIRASDTACRYGGDEFVVVLPDFAATGRIRAWAQRLRRQIARPFSWQGKDLRVRTSIGVAVYPRDTRDATQLLDRADQAMFRAKSRSTRPRSASAPQPAVGAI